MAKSVLLALLAYNLVSCIVFGHPDEYVDFERDIRQAMDTSVDPCADFYSYACGGWLKAHPELPADKSKESKGFTATKDDNIQHIRDLILAMDESEQPRQLYESCMSQDTSIKALAPLLLRIDAAQTLDQFMHVAGQLARIQVPFLFSADIAVDPKKPTSFMLLVADSALTMNSDIAHQNATRVLLLTDHITKMLKMVGIANPEEIAHDIIQFETSLSEIQDDKDLGKMSFPNGLGSIADLPQTINFAGWIHSMYGDIDGDAKVVRVRRPGLVVKLAEKIGQTSLEMLKNWLRWSVIHSYAAIMPKRFSDESFRFFQQVLKGEKLQLPRWESCVTLVESLFQEKIGQAYVAANFDVNAKEVASKILESIQKSFIRTLSLVNWMDDATKKLAIEKVNAMTKNVGYPDIWPSVGDSVVLTKEAGLLGNVIVIRNCVWIEKYPSGAIFRPVDKSAWSRPTTVANAFYNPMMNTIFLPAGIMQPPFFSQNHPAPLNFGSIGIVIGHELTHGFDNRGRQYDASGRLRKWWPDEVSKEYERRADCFTEQYSRFTVDGKNVSGARTLGENIADNGSLEIVLHALQAFEEENESERVLPEMTPSQLFFIAFGQTFCARVRPRLAKTMIKSDPHSPAKARVNAAIENSVDFARAFQCAEASKTMNPVKKCDMWSP